MNTIILVALVGFGFCCVLVALAIGIIIGQRHPVKQNKPQVPAQKPQPQAPVSPQPPAKVACRHCGRLNKPNAKYCVGCGKLMGNCRKLAPICRKCGKEQRLGSKFCKSDGEPLT